MNPTLPIAKATYQSGEVLPTVGTPTYQAAQALAATPVNTLPSATAIQGVSSLQVPADSPSSAHSSLDAHLGSAIMAPSTATVDSATGLATTPTPPPEPTGLKAITAKLSGLYDKMAGKGEAVSQIEDRVQVNEKEQAAVDTFNTFNKRRLELQKQEQDFLNTNTGGTTADKQFAFNEMKRNNSYELANQAIAVQAAQGNYTAALDTIKRKTDAIYSPIQDQIDNLEKFYQLNQNDLSESEKVTLQAKIDEQKAQKKVLSDAYENTLATLAENGAPSNVYAAIDKAAKDPNATASTIISAAGKYAQNILDRQVKEANIEQSRASAAASYASAAKSRQSGSSVEEGVISPMTQAVIDNPNLLNSLTPTVKGQVIAQLQANGYDTTRLGAKPLSDTAIAAIAQDQNALASLSELKTAIEGNEQYLGPVKGWQVLNPYSPAKQLQAKVDLVRQKVGKALEGGVLRKEDEEKYKKILTTLADTKELSTAKIDNLIGTIQTGLDNYTALQTGAGKSSNVTGSLSKKAGETIGKTSTGNSYSIIKK